MIDFPAFLTLETGTVGCAYVSFKVFGERKNLAAQVAFQLPRDQVTWVALEVFTSSKNL